MGFFSGNPLDSLGGIGGALPNFGSVPYLGRLMTNPSKTLTVQNTFQGQTPDINRMSFGNALGLGQNAYTNALGNMGAIGTGLEGLAAQQNALSGGYVPIAAQQGQAAANIGGLGADIAALASAQGGVLGQQQNLYGQQQSLANALQAQAMGQGPNPAQAQFMQNINSADQQAAGLIASQRGLNPALQAQLIANQQGQANQSAAGQAAVLQAQQQLAAQQQLQAQQGAQLMNLSNQGQSVAGIGNIYGQAANLYGNQANVLGAQGNTLGSQLGGINQAGNTLGQAGNLYSNQGQLGNQFYGQNLQGQAAQNTEINKGSLGAQNISAAAAAQNAAETQKTQAGFISGLGGAIGQLAGGYGMGSAAAGVYKGGEIGYDQGGLVDNLVKLAPLAIALLANQGGPVPGQAKVKKDSPKNDTVPAMLSPGEIVLPLSVTQAPDAAAKAAEFVEKLKSGKGKHYGDVIQARKKVEKYKKAA